MIPSTFGISFCMTDHYYSIHELSVNMLCSFFNRVVFFLNFKSSLQPIANIYWLSCMRYGYAFHIVQHNRNCYRVAYSIFLISSIFVVTHPFSLLISIFHSLHIFSCYDLKIYPFCWSIRRASFLLYSTYFFCFLFRIPYSFFFYL